MHSRKRSKSFKSGDETLLAKTPGKDYSIVDPDDDEIKSYKRKFSFRRRVSLSCTSEKQERFLCKWVSLSKEFEECNRSNNDSELDSHIGTETSQESSDSNFNGKTSDHIEDIESDEAGSEIVGQERNKYFMKRRSKTNTKVSDTPSATSGSSFSEEVSKGDDDAVVHKNMPEFKPEVPNDFQNDTSPVKMAQDFEVDIRECTSPSPLKFATKFLDVTAIKSEFLKSEVQIEHPANLSLSQVLTDTSDEERYSVAKNFTKCELNASGQSKRTFQDQTETQEAEEQLSTMSLNKDLNPISTGMPERPWENQFHNSNKVPKHKPKYVKGLIDAFQDSLQDEDKLDETSFNQGPSPLFSIKTPNFFNVTPIKCNFYECKNNLLRDLQEIQVSQDSSNAFVSARTPSKRAYSQDEISENRFNISGYSSDIPEEETNNQGIGKCHVEGYTGLSTAVGSNTCYTDQLIEADKLSDNLLDISKPSPGTTQIQPNKPHDLTESNIILVGGPIKSVARCNERMKSTESSQNVFNISECSTDTPQNWPEKSQDTVECDIKGCLSPSPIRFSTKFPDISAIASEFVDGEESTWISPPATPTADKHNAAMKGSEWVQEISKNTKTPKKSQDKSEIPKPPDSTKKRFNPISGGLAEQLQRLRAREASARNIWMHQTAFSTSSAVIKSLPMSLTITNVEEDTGLVIAKCNRETSNDSVAHLDKHFKDKTLPKDDNLHTLSRPTSEKYSVIFPSHIFHKYTLSCGSSFILYAPWQIIDVANLPHPVILCPYFLQVAK